jgi:hypothetical protein
MNGRRMSVGLVAAALIAGCGSSNHVAPVSTPTTQTATDLDPQLSEPSYWYDQPATSRTAAASFDVLWDAAQEVSRDLLFRIDRQDRRAGVLTTEALISAQWFEPWRRELQSADTLADSSVATIRRTIRYEFEKQGEAYVVIPKVLVERQSIAERRVSGALNRLYFRRDRELGASGTRETDAGVYLPDSYWYAIGRDAALESYLASRINAQL